MRSRETLAALVAAGALLLAGCGDDESAQPAEDATDDAIAAERDTRATELTESMLTFTATTVAGDEFAAADLAGRPAVFWFWAPWCPTCVAEAPDVLDVADEYSDAVSVVGVASLGEASEMEDFIALTDTASLTHLNDEDGEVWRHFGITAQSTFALVDEFGVATYAGYLSAEELADRVAELAG